MESDTPRLEVSRLGLRRFRIRTIPENLHLLIPNPRLFISECHLILEVFLIMSGAPLYQYPTCHFQCSPNSNSHNRFIMCSAGTLLYLSRRHHPNLLSAEGIVSNFITDNKVLLLTTANTTTVHEILSTHAFRARNSFLQFSLS